MSIPGGLASSYFDVTVRCPHSLRNSQDGRAASMKTAVAATDGESDKLNRYGSLVASCLRDLWQTGLQEPGDA